jgi:hypothetical protein
MKNCKAIMIGPLMAALAVPLLAVETSFWQVGSFEDFLQGTMTNVALGSEGELKISPEIKAVFSPDENLALSLAADRNHNVYVGTGHQGKVFKVDPQQKGSVFFKAQEPDVFALAVGPDGALYVGTSPEGKIYRVTSDGKSSAFYDPKTKYIWALAFDTDGRLYAGTGDQGKIFRIDPNGKGSLFYDAKQTHIMCLAYEKAGNLLAGSVPNGLIYRITPQGKAFVIYQASLPEVHALALDSQGDIYAATLGGAGGKGSPDLLIPAGPAPTGASSVTTVTVEASTDDAPEESAKAQNPPSAASTPPSFNRPSAPSVILPVTKMPQGKGALIEIHPDASVETVWSSNNETIFGLAVRNNQVLFSTDAKGRIFNLTPSREGSNLTLLAQTKEALATRLLLEGGDLYAATASVAKLFRLGANPGAEGTFESQVKDTKFVSHWGTVVWRGETPAGTGIQFFTRSGNTDRPDATWSDWDGPLSDPNGSPIKSPAARFIQWKAVLHGSGSATPALDDVTLSYLNQNLAPEIRSFSISTAGERASPTGGSANATPFSGGIVNVTSSTSFSSSAPPKSQPEKVPVTLNWQADDPNGDTLIYSLYLKAADEEEWHLLKNRLAQTSFTLDPASFADGRYQAKLIASDEEANPPGIARQAEMVSAPFWIDNTPPEVTVLKSETRGGGIQVQFQAEDSVSPLHSAEFSIDGQEWEDVYSDDGVVDSRRESFTVKAGKLAPGEHVVSLRAFDSAGNAGVGKAVIHVP